MTYGKIFYTLFFALLVVLIGRLIDWSLVPSSPFSHWSLFVFAEIGFHAWLINKKINTTPENMKWGRRFAIVAPRFLAGALLVYFHHLALIEALVFLGGALFIHFLIFGPFLNKLTGKGWAHLDDGYTDRALHLISRGHFFGRVFILFISSAGFITLFYWL